MDGPIKNTLIYQETHHQPIFISLLTMSSSPSRNLAVNENMNPRDDERQHENLPTPPPSPHTSSSHPPQTPLHQPSPSSSSPTSSSENENDNAITSSPPPQKILYHLYARGAGRTRRIFAPSIGECENMIRNKIWPPSPSPSPQTPPPSNVNRRGDTTSSESEEDPDMERCSICGHHISLRLPHNHHNPTLVTICGHYFHERCLGERIRCPRCRRDLRPPPGN